MTSGQHEDADNTKREQRQRRIRIVVGLFMLMLGVPPLLNALGNPRVQALHGADVLGLIASGLVIGFGLGLLLRQDHVSRTVTTLNSSKALRRIRGDKGTA